MQIYGPESCGKTTLALHAIAEVQKLAKESGEEMYVMYVDVEQAIDPEHVKVSGTHTHTHTHTHRTGVMHECDKACHCMCV